MRATEVDLAEAVKLLDLAEEVVCRLAEAGKLKSRRAAGELYMVREEAEALRRRQIEEVRAQEAS